MPIEDKSMLGRKVPPKLALGLAGVLIAFVAISLALVDRPEIHNATPMVANQTTAEQLPLSAKAIPQPSASGRGARDGSSRSAYRLMVIDTARLDSGKILVSGHTDLPDGASLIISAARKTKLDTDPDYSVDDYVTVVGGKWSVSLNAPTAPEFNQEPHVVNASWTPVGQSSSVLASTGENGEKLEGPSTKKVSGTDNTMFDVEKEVRFNIGKAQKDSLPSPNSFAVGTPKRAVAEVLKDWEGHKWSRMSDRVFSVSDPSRAHRLEMCKSQFDFWDVHQAEIADVDMSADPIYDFPGNIAKVTVHVKATVGAEVKEQDMTWVVLRLGGDNRPSIHGRWRVNIEAIGPK